MSYFIRGLNFPMSNALWSQGLCVTHFFILYCSQINVLCFQSVLSEMNWMAWYSLLCSSQVWGILIGDDMVFEITVTEQKDPESTPYLTHGSTV